MWKLKFSARPSSAFRHGASSEAFGQSVPSPLAHLAVLSSLDLCQQGALGLTLHIGPHPITDRCFRLVLSFVGFSYRSTSLLSCRDMPPPYPAHVWSFEDPSGHREACGWLLGAYFCACKGRTLSGKGQTAKSMHYCLRVGCIGGAASHRGGNLSCGLLGLQFWGSNEHISYVVLHFKSQVIWDW